MRMWSLHPHHLDRVGLVACWRESLLAQAVLAGRTRGYRNHPQLVRFRVVPAPVTPALAVGAYLWGLREEAVRRGYCFDASRIDTRQPDCTGVSLTVTEGQVLLERRHLEAKLAGRAPELLPLPDRPETHPIFQVVPGGVEPWERALTP